MKFNISFRNMDSSPAITAYAEEKSSRLKIYFQGNTHFTWNFSQVRGEWIAHCHLVGNHIDFFGEAQTTDIHVSIDQTLDKLEKQLRKHKEIVTNHLHHAAANPPVVTEDNATEE